MYKNKYRKKLAGLLTTVLLATTICSGHVLAEEKEPVDTRTKEGEAISTEEAYAMEVDSNAWEDWPQGPQTYGEADIVMDADTGAILYAKNIDGKAYPASITKVLTLLIALENGNLEDKVTFSTESVHCVPYGYAHIGMKAGEEITLEDALYGMMLASANEVAYAIGDSVGESYEWFIQEMNDRCKELGAVNSNFVNTNGLDDENHYTTARDMALITQELLLHHPEFEEISQTLQYTIPATAMAESRTFQQNHKMFYASHKNYDARVIAGKTGYTDIAKNTLVTCSDDGKMKLICIALKTHGTNVYDDTQALLNYGYDNFEQIDVSSMEKSEDIGAFVGKSCVTVPKGVSFDDLAMQLTPDEEEQGKGKAVYTYNGKIVGELEIEYSQSYLKANSSEIEIPEKEENSKKEGSSFKTYIKYGIIGILVIIGLLFVVVVILIIRKRKIEKERRRRRAAMRRRRMQEQRRREGE